jgi:hypothetical protein
MFVLHPTSSSFYNPRFIEIKPVFKEEKGLFQRHGRRNEHRNRYACTDEDKKVPSNPPMRLTAMSRPTAGLEIPKVACISGNAGDILDTPITAISVSHDKDDLKIRIAVTWPSVFVLDHRAFYSVLHTGYIFPVLE